MFVQPKGGCAAASECVQSVSSGVAGRERTADRAKLKPVNPTKFEFCWLTGFNFARSAVRLIMPAALLLTLCTRSLTVVHTLLAQHALHVSPNQLNLAIPQFALLQECQMLYLWFINHCSNHHLSNARVVREMVYKPKYNV